jgi:GNAT superfamily N-acetyltransferase
MSDTESGIRIRRAAAGDLEGLVASSAGLSAEDGALRDPLRNPEWAQLHAARSYTEHLANPDTLVLVAEHGGGVVGHLLGAYYGPSDMWSAARAYLISMYVQPAWRGQQAGSRLVDGFTAWARDRGAAQLRVTAYSANEQAIRFYARHGFLPLESTFAADLSPVR